MGCDISYDHLVGWEADLRLLTERVAGSLFTRPEPRATFTDLVRGLLADVPRKYSWQLAEHVEHGSAYRLEWLLNGAKWDADALRDRVRDYVVGTLGAEDGVLIADDTADPSAADPAPSLAEIRSLLARSLLAATRGIDHILHWSLFRRLHQTRALISHYRRRGDPLPAELRM